MLVSTLLFTCSSTVKLIHKHLLMKTLMVIKATSLKIVVCSSILQMENNKVMQQLVVTDAYFKKHHKSTGIYL